jgi:hypothetical protein
MKDLPRKESRGQSLVGVVGKLKNSPAEEAHCSKFEDVYA